MTKDFSKIIEILGTKHGGTIHIEARAHGKHDDLSITCRAIIDDQCNNSYIGESILRRNSLGGLQGNHEFFVNLTIVGEGKKVCIVSEDYLGEPHCFSLKHFDDTQKDLDHNLILGKDFLHRVNEMIKRS